MVAKMINKHPKAEYVLWFDQVGKEDTGIVGGKGANLGEMTRAGFQVPPGFIVSAYAYKTFINVNGLAERIKMILERTDVNKMADLNESSDKIKKLILTGKMPKAMALEILKAYNDLSGLNEEPALVAVRSSATAEDLPGASFAGQQATFLNVFGDHEVVKKVQACWASLFEPRAIFYREQKHFDHFRVFIAVPVQKMVQSEVSGVMFTINPTTNDKKEVVIEAVWGLGEMIVQGAVTPDHYEVEKQSMEIIRKEVAKQTIQLVMAGTENKELAVPKGRQEKQKISNEKIKELAEIGKKLQQHYFFPQDVEWAYEKGKLYIVQTRPITTISEVAEKGKMATGGESLPKVLEGSSASPGVATGTVKVVRSPKEIGKVLLGDVLVAQMTSPDYVPAMRKASAIVTDRGGATSHAAIVSRELGIPCVVGTEKATKTLRDGVVITVNGSTGEVFKGGHIGASKELSLSSQQVSGPLVAQKTATHVYVNLAEPDRVTEVAKMPVDGVGLLRAEFMIAGIGVHPKKAIKDGKRSQFIEKLAEGLKTFCEAFSPRPVIYRATDFKTNEYRNLIGGHAYEPIEPNPMLGFRGAARYVADPEVFELELAAIKKIREKENLKNLWLMIPFVRSPRELREVKKIVVSSGLARSPTFRLLMMAEIPTNVIRLEDFLDVGIDGISIGSNDLTMMVLGADRDNEEVVSDYNELDPSVLWALERLVKTCRKYKVTSSICGQAPSTYPELVEKLVEWGITSVSVNPDAVGVTRKMVAEAEKKLVRKRG